MELIPTFNSPTFSRCVNYIVTSLVAKISSDMELGTIGEVGEHTSRLQVFFGPDIVPMGSWIITIIVRRSTFKGRA